MRKNRFPQRTLALVTLAALLTACATKLPDSIPVQPPRIPPPPATLMKPPSPESYSERASRSIKEWLQTLTDSESK